MANPFNTDQWAQSFPGGITVCDAQSNICWMNDKAITNYESAGGAQLIGSNMLDCHPDHARAKIEQMLLTHQQNIYVTDKNGVKKLFIQSPLTQNGGHSGFIEISLIFTGDIPTYKRGG